MSEIKELIINTDDDYLIGLSNKGIVKRAYKDLESQNIEIIQFKETIKLKVADEECEIFSPLGESKCSCPSRSICKHIILAVLFLKNNLKQEINNNEEKGEKELIEKSFKEIEDFPIDKLKKVLSVKNYNNVLGLAKANIFPKIKKSSFISVYFEDTDITVKLLEPVEFSTCSCHKKEICVHKAQAILFYKILIGKVSVDDLEEENIDLDIEYIHKICKDINGLLQEQMVTGLSRCSLSVADTMERFATICHNGKLANFESIFRELNRCYKDYFKKSATFSVEYLMNKILYLYEMSNKILDTNDLKKLKELSGEFRSEYHYIKDMVILGIGSKRFESKNGYEGQTIYFLEENGNKWYTYTSVRPTYYDKKISVSIYENAPWGLNCNLKEMKSLKIKLRGAKATKENNLSSSNETYAHILDNREITDNIIKKWFYEDFEKLFDEKIESRDYINKKEFLFIKADYCEQPIFDSINQVFLWKLYDKFGKHIYLHILYSKIEENRIKFFENIGKKVYDKLSKMPIIMGRVFLFEGKMRFEPIECFWK